MSNPNPFESLFDQIADLLALVQEKKLDSLKGKIDEGVEEQVDFLEERVNFFRKITDEAIRMSGIDEEVLKETIDNPQDSPLLKKNVKLMERANKLKGELEKIEKEFDRRGKFAQLQKKKEKTTGKKRKKKFQRLGGQGWIPM